MRTGFVAQRTGAAAIAGHRIRVLADMRRTTAPATEQAWGVLGGLLAGYARMAR